MRMSFGSNISVGHSGRHCRHRPRHRRQGPSKPMGPNGLLAMAVVGALMLGSGAFMAVKQKQFIDSAVRVEGTVIELDKRYSSSSSSSNTHHRDKVTYAPIFTYTDTTGALHKVVSSFSTNPPTYQIGEKVTVLYDPQKPSQGELGDLFSQWGFSGIVGGIGLILLLCGAIGRANYKPPVAEATVPAENTTPPAV